MVTYSYLVTFGFENKIHYVTFQMRLLLILGTNKIIHMLRTAKFNAFREKKKVERNLACYKKLSKWSGIPIYAT